MRYPANHRAAPVSDQTRTAQRLSPKGGIVWRPSAMTSIRIAHAQGLTGTSFDQSFAVEPTQVAGVNQAFRSLIPESIAGANAGVRLKITAAGWEQRLGERTYAAASVARYESPLVRDIGVFERPVGTDTLFVPSTIREKVVYSEDVVGVSLRRLFGEHWSAGVDYHWSEAHRRFDHPAIPRDLDLGDSAWSPRRRETSALNRLGFDTRFQHRCGFFAETRWEWWSQDNQRGLAGIADASFWRGDILVGWRFARRRAEATVGVLNVGDQFEPLAALSGVTGTIRERTFVARLRMAF
jgi:outer membrane receptor protein involved in Fe transport